MPDSDIVRRGLAPRYSTPYKHVCEGIVQPEVLSDQFSRKTLRHLKRLSELPEVFQQLSAALANHRGPLPDLYAAGERILRRAGSNIDKRTRAVLAETFKLCIQDRTASRAVLCEDRLVASFSGRL